MRTKGAVLATVGIVALSSASGAAEDSPTHEQPILFSAAVSALSDYIARGISQTAGDPAAQGWVQMTGRASEQWPKLYAGVWASTIDFPESDVETDLYAGVRDTLAGVDWDLVVIRYLYPDADSEARYQFTEVGGSFAVQILSARTQIGTLYSPQNWGGSGKSFWSFANLRIPFDIAGHNWTVVGQVARRVIELNDRFGVPDYRTYSLGLETEYVDLAFALFYSDTNLSSEVCPRDRCGPRIVFQATKYF